MFCKKCGNELEKGDGFCTKCGTPTKSVRKEKTEEFYQNEEESYNNQRPIYQNPGQMYQPQGVYQPQYAMYRKPKEPGSGLSVAGMVLGIIGLVFAIIYMIMMFDKEYVIQFVWEHKVSSEVELGVIFTIIPMILALIGLPLSIAGMVKKAGPKNITGLILNSFAILISIFIFIYIIVTYG